MPQRELVSRPIIQCLRSRPKCENSSIELRLRRTFVGAASQQNEAQPQTQQQPFYRNPDPLLVSSPRLERRLARAGTPPVGSRRRRLALQQTSNIPFEQLPYQCFQEARKVLQEDREEKLKQIEIGRTRIARVKAVGEESGQVNQAKLWHLEKHLERLKIYADINDPLVKKRFEDGLGDMSKPIYRFLADKKWREYRRPVLMQRLTQMSVVPDVLPLIDPTADVRLYFGRRGIQQGDFVESTTSETAPPRLDIQLFEKGEKMITIAIVDSDVPNLVKDGFDSRCHFLAINIPISPTSTLVDLARLPEQDQVVVPWKAPYAQKGSPYHRLSTIVLTQKNGEPLDVAAVQAKVNAEDFRLRALITRHSLNPIGAHLFRTKWDEGMAAVMARAGIEGADVELKRARIEPLPYKRRNPSSMR